MAADSPERRLSINTPSDTPPLPPVLVEAAGGSVVVVQKAAPSAEPAA